MMTNYVIASTTRFRAATSGAGSSNALAEYGTDQYVREYEQELGTPWKSIDNYLKVSFPVPPRRPDHDADALPLRRRRLQHAAAELRADVPGAARASACRRSSSSIPGQHHGIRKPSFQRDRLERYVAWYDRYLKAGSAGGSAAGPAGR